MSGDCIDLMIKEHENVMRLVEIFRVACCGILEGRDVDQEDFATMIFLARTYADSYHHGKEEKILFHAMEQQLGTAAQKLIRNGMLVEHDMGRFHMGALEEALKRYEDSGATIDKLAVVTNASAWADLLQRHIEKEDTVVYLFARNHLPNDIMMDVEKEMEAYDRLQTAAGIQQQSLQLLAKIEQKYGLER